MSSLVVVLEEDELRFISFFSFVKKKFKKFYLFLSQTTFFFGEQDGIKQGIHVQKQAHDTRNERKKNEFN